MIASRFWPVLWVAFCIVLAMTASYKRGWSAHSIWPAYEAKMRAPLTPTVPKPDDEIHVTKLDLRITVPLIGYALGFERRGLAGLYLGCGFLTLLLAYFWMQQQAGDRATASAFCLACASVSAGSQGFIGSPFYDPIALLLGVACLWKRALIPLVAVGVVTAFVDERAVLMLPAVLLAQWSARFVPDSGTHANMRRVAEVVTAGFSIVVLVWLVRRWLQVEFRLQSPQQDDFVGVAVLSSTLAYAPILALSSIELLWIPVGMSLRSQWQRSSAPAALMAASLLTPLLASFLVLDVSRSMAYALPAIVYCCGRLPGHLSTAALRSLFSGVALGNVLIWDLSFYGSLMVAVPAPMAWWLSS